MRNLTRGFEIPFSHFLIKNSKGTKQSFDAETIHVIPDLPKSGAATVGV